jgi:CubicO group peptidase (beta-lactamase class C family)
MRFFLIKKSISAFSLTIFLFFIFVQSNASESDTNYPTNEWYVSTPEEQGMQSKTLFQMIEAIKEQKYNIHSITIVRNGSLVLDSYLYPFQYGKKHKMYSATKSVTSALIGIAIDKGHIKDVHQPITHFFPDKTISNLDDLKRSLTLKNLLIMASGFDCEDGSANKWATTVEMRKSEDWTQYALNLPMARKPGEHYQYCNGVSHLLSAIIHKSTGMQPLAFAQKYLFDPLGIKDVEWETSPEGIVSGWGGLSLLPKDMAKIGLLFLNKGRWEKQQIISTDWVEESIQPYIDGRWNGEDYGYQWWINQAGYYSAVGMFGQAIYVVPKKKLVAVFTSHIEGTEMYISGTLLREYIIPAAVSTEPLPSAPLEKTRLGKLLTRIARAPEQGIVWSTENEGIANDGIFKRAASPSFQFEYPFGCTKTQTRQPDQIMRMKTPSNGIITASIYKIPRNWKSIFQPMKLEDFGPKEYASWMKKYGSNITVTSNDELMLKDGTVAYRTDFEWTMKNNKSIITNLVSTYKNDKCIYIAVHQFQKNKIIEPIIRSWTFE